MYKDVKISLLYNSFILYMLNDREERDVSSTDHMRTPGADGTLLSLLS